MKKELVGYIRRQLERGHTLNDIYDVLLQYGWPVEHIADAMENINDQILMSEQEQQSTRMKYVFVPMVSLIVLVSAFSLILSWDKLGLTGAATVNLNDNCIYKLGETSYKIGETDCCNFIEALGEESCEFKSLPYFVDGQYVVFDYICEKGKSTVYLSEGMYKRCG